ncbi:hypothetical protein GCM10009738_85740 [Kitasatospora viridis]
MISGIGFAGSYSAVRELALHKGFGAFSYAFPIGVDAGIVVLLALDLVLTWLRIPFPLLRQAAWLLTVATISFNAAASWGDPLGMGMHAVIPVLFVVVVEASRHAVGRIAAITADRHMESVRLMRWLLSPVPTFRMWRRMKLWELRSYDEVVRLEQNRLVYRAQLRFRYGRGWRRAAPIQALLPLKLAKFGVPLDVTLLDRIDPSPATAVVQQEQPAAVEPLPAQPASPQPTDAQSAADRPTNTQSGQARQSGGGFPAAAVAPVLAKLASERWRDSQVTAEQPTQQQHAQPTLVDGPVTQAQQTPARAARPVAALRDIRAGRPADLAVPNAQQQQPQQQSQHQQPPAAEHRQAQASPWFATARPSAPEPQPAAPQARPVQQPQHPQQPAAAAAAAGPQRPPLTGAQLIALAEGRPQAAAPAAAEVVEQPQLDLDAPAGHPAEPAPSIERQVENVFAPRVPVAPQQDEEPVEFGRELTVDVAVEGLVSYLDTHNRHPDQELLAGYLFSEYGVTGRRPGVQASRSEMARIWPQLQDRYATLGRE